MGNRRHGRNDRRRRGGRRPSRLQYELFEPAIQPADQLRDLVIAVLAFIAVLAPLAATASRLIAASGTRKMRNPPGQIVEPGVHAGQFCCVDLGIIIFMPRRANPFLCRLLDDYGV